MDHKITPYPQPSPRPRRRRRRSRIPWSDILLTLLAVLTCWLILLAVKDHPVSSSGGSATETPPPRQAPAVESSAENGLSNTEQSDWRLTLVNGENAIPQDYEIDLVEVPGGQKVDGRIYEPLMEMLEAAKAGNREQAPKVVSGYRTQEKQRSLYDDKIAKYEKQGYATAEAKRMAEQWVAVPEYSEHQLGLAVDINGATYDLYLWLQDNSYKYGFIFRYPGNKTELTGVAEEVWHYRYVGVEAATQMYEQDLCLEEYLEQKRASA